MPKALLRAVSVAPTCALTVDVEDWYQSFADRSAPLTERVIRNTDRLLQLLSDHSVRATFFVLGEVARRFPELVRRIADEGHEVQSHGDRHVPLTELKANELRQALIRARESIEDACGRAVTAFRAPYFSIGPTNLDYLRVVREAGYSVDSSIFPMAMRRYGIEGWPVEPRRVQVSETASLIEAPVSVYSTGQFRFPIAGGGYLRLLPESFVERACRSLIGRGQPVVLYCHPYEFNAGEVDEYRSVPWLARRLQGMGRGSAPQRWGALLKALPFGSLQQVLETYPTLPLPHALPVAYAASPAQELSCALP
jgi:polysaccharide deacetylase family protein (PEP-CTERM system associated)